MSLVCLGNTERPWLSMLINSTYSKIIFLISLEWCELYGHRQKHRFHIAHMLPWILWGCFWCFLTSINPIACYFSMITCLLHVPWDNVARWILMNTNNWLWRYWFMLLLKYLILRRSCCYSIDDYLFLLLWLLVLWFDRVWILFRCYWLQRNIIKFIRVLNKQKKIQTPYQELLMFHLSSILAKHASDIEWWLHDAEVVPDFDWSMRLLHYLGG